MKEKSQKSVTFCTLYLCLTPQSCMSRLKKKNKDKNKNHPNETSTKNKGSEMRYGP